MSNPARVFFDLTLVEDGYDALPTSDNEDRSAKPGLVSASYFASNNMYGTHRNSIAPLNGSIAVLTNFVWYAYFDPKPQMHESVKIPFWRLRSARDGMERA